MLLYLGFTRHDISYATQQLSQYMQHPCSHHQQAAFHLLRYIKVTLQLGLHYPAQAQFQISAFCDADWGKCKITRKSLTGYCFFLGRSLISWKTKKQSIVSRSTAEAKYRSMAHTSSELKWISYLMDDFNLNFSLPIQLNCDNQVAMAIAKNPIFHERTKHIEIDCHIIKSLIEEGFIKTAFGTSNSKLADSFTKSVTNTQMTSTQSKLGLLPLVHNETQVHCEEG